MLHEILLSLSGIPSPIWDDVRDGKNPKNRDDQDKSLGSLTSPAEKAMLEILAELADLHIKVRDTASSICSSHPSPICRAIANRVRTHHLRAFVDKVIEVETSVLDQDAAYVGAYRIVPLSTVVSDFQPWLRPMRWFWKIVRPLISQGAEPLLLSSGAATLRTLRTEAQTGYTDIKAISEDLLVIAHRSWLSSLMPWILYGSIPSVGTADFMIQEGPSSADFLIQDDLVPYFITAATAETILSIGLALRQIAPRSGLAQKNSNLTSSCTSLMPASLQKISALHFPLQDMEVSKVAVSINDTISQAALSVILPASVIFDLLLILQDYVLLRNGEFSTCLIQQVDQYLASYSAASKTAGPVRKLGRVDDMNLNETETSTILDKTWSELLAFIPEKDSEDQLRDKAAELIRLVPSPTVLPVNSLLPNAASLVLQLSSNSPLRIFISATDIDAYRTLGAYLVSIRRAEYQLTKLWREPALRRCYPTPLGPPRSATDHGRKVLTTRRQREDRRSAYMRQHWASITQLLFLISEMGNYFHGEVMQNSWTALYTWLDLDTGSRPSSSKASSRPATSSSHAPVTNPSSTRIHGSSGRSHTRKNDPRTIARAHRRYLDALHHCLLLNNTHYTTLLSDLLTQIDHYVALFDRLRSIWQGLDLQEDESITNAFANHQQEETEVTTEMQRTNTKVTENLHDLIGTMRDIEKQRDLPDLTTGAVQLNISSSNDTGTDTFEPWRARTLDRLLMKLDSLAADDKSENFEDALVEMDDA